jgi:predicted nucleic acid-binding protein
MIHDPNDDKFVTAAINGNAEAIVTFNIRDYVPRDGRVTGLGIEVCRPGTILRRLSWRPSATLPFGYLRH